MTSRAHWPVVAIVGVGMIGGSIGKAVRARRLASLVLGIGRSAESLAAAKKTGCVTDTATDLAAAADADLVVVAAGVGAIPTLLDAVDAVIRPGTLLTDAGSTKASIVSGKACTTSGLSRRAPTESTISGKPAM
jgi:prephenate dehydrogenase